MASFRIVPTRFAATLILILGAFVAAATWPSGAARAESPTEAVDREVPAIVIDAEYVPAQAVGYVVYVPHEQEMLAMDAASGAIRAVFPAPPRIPAHSGVLAALTSGSVSVPAVGILLLATLFLALVAIVFMRRAPVGV
jgi:hypothetical protein